MSPVAGTQQYGPSTSSARDTVTTGHQHAVPPPHPQPLPLPLPCCCYRQPPPPPAALMPSQAACVRAAVDGVPALLQPLEAHRSILSGSLRGALASRPRRWSPASPQHAQAGTGHEASRPAYVLRSSCLGYLFITPSLYLNRFTNLLCRKPRAIESRFWIVQDLSLPLVSAISNFLGLDLRILRAWFADYASRRHRVTPGVLSCSKCKGWAGS